MFSSNPINRQNENLPSTIDYRPVGLSQPTSIPPASFANRSGTTSNYGLPQAPAPGTPIQNWQPGILENSNKPTLRYSPGVPATQSGHPTHLHPGTSLNAPPMVSPTRLPHDQLNNWPSSNPSMASPCPSNLYQTEILLRSAGQQGEASSERSNTDSPAEFSMMVCENRSSAISLRGPERLPIRRIPAKKPP